MSVEIGPYLLVELIQAVTAFCAIPPLDARLNKSSIARNLLSVREDMVRLATPSICVADLERRQICLQALDMRMQVYLVPRDEDSKTKNQRHILI